MNHYIVIFIVLFAVSLFAKEALSPERIANTIILDDVKTRNLGIELAEASELDFEETLFVIGRIAEVPSKHSVLSSRVPGRIVSLNATLGDIVEEGQTLVEVESRLPGNPPPVIPLEAPVRGLVFESHVRIGQPVEPSNELLDIVDLTEVWAVAKVPEQDAVQLKIGAKARIKISAFGDEEFSGELVRFGNTANAQAGTLDAIFHLQNPEMRLRPGMRAEFSIVISSKKDVLAVPKLALQGDLSNRVVYVKDFELPHAYVKCPVEIGSQNDQYVEILSGVFPGDEVVTKGSYFLGFSSGDSLSLKEALDAAHGHEHNADGSEMSEEQKSSRLNEAGGHAKHSEQGPKVLFLSVACGFLVLLLFLSGVKHAKDQKLIHELRK